MRILAVLTAMAALAVAAPAHADWQWTKWGMTPDEVIAASGGKAAYTSSGRLGLSEPLTIQDCAFNVFFGFDDNKKLERVALETKADCSSSMINILNINYGEPVTSGEHVQIYVDKVKGNQISIAEIYGTTIMYRPIPGGL